MRRLFRNTRRRNRIIDSVEDTAPVIEQSFGEDDVNQTLIANNTFVVAVPLGPSVPSKQPPQPIRKRAHRQPVARFFRRYRGQESAQQSGDTASQEEILAGFVSFDQQDEPQYGLIVDEVTGEDRPLHIDSAAFDMPSKEAARQDGYSCSHSCAVSTVLPSEETVNVCESRKLPHQSVSGDHESKNPISAPTVSNHTALPHDIENLLSQGVLGVGIPLEEATERATPDFHRTDYVDNRDLEACLKHLEVQHEMESQRKSVELKNRRLALQMHIKNAESTRSTSSRSSLVGIFLYEQHAELHNARCRSPP